MEVNVVVVCLKIDVTNNEKMYGMNNKSSSAFRKFGLNIILSSNNSEIFSPLNAELNPPCYLLALLAHYFLHVSRIRVKQQIRNARNIISILLSWILHSFVAHALFCALLGFCF